jgi:hypothetical protein
MAEINHDPKGQFYWSPVFWGCASAFITIIVTVIAAMTKDLRWLLAVAWPFAALTVWEFARTWGSSRRIKWVTSGGSGVAAIALVALYFWLAPEVPPIPTAHEPANPTPFAQPVLSLMPVERDAHISWPSPQTAPKTHDGKSPFALVIRNIGGPRAIHLVGIEPWFIGMLPIEPISIPDIEPWSMPPMPMSAMVRMGRGSIGGIAAAMPGLGASVPRA